MPDKESMVENSEGVYSETDNLWGVIADGFSYFQQSLPVRLNPNHIAIYLSGIIKIVLCAYALGRKDERNNNAANR